MYTYDQKPGTRIADSSAQMVQALRDSEYSVLVGRNNCGKSYLLKHLTQAWGDNATYLGPSRYQNFNLLGYYTPNRNRKSERRSQFLRFWQQKDQNIDNSPVDLQQAIAELSDKQRSALREIIKLLLGIDLEIRDTVPGNSMSQKYVSCSGHNLSFTSSGFRLIMTIVTSLLNEECDTYLIDEPELGISPEAQGVLADFLFDRNRRTKYFPHIKTLILATHSTIFLDRSNIRNNYQISKQGDEISIDRVDSYTDFNNIHFFLLGNRFETLYLPSAIVLVEGKSDYLFIEKVLSKRYPSSRVSVIAANSDSRIKEVLNTIKGVLSDLQKSPYRERIMVILDSVISSSTIPDELARLGVSPDKIVKWPRNGIEYYYPSTLVDSIYGVGSELEINGDIISRNGVSYPKAELASKIVAALDETTPLNEEFDLMFIQKIDPLIRQ